MPEKSSKLADIEKKWKGVVYSSDADAVYRDLPDTHQCGRTVV